MKVSTKPYGEWESPITAGDLSYISVSLNAPRSSRDGQALYYLEADCNGHGHIKRTNPPSYATSDDFSIGTDIYSYGGGAYIVDADGFLVFADSITQCVYRSSPDGSTIDALVSAPNTVYGDLSPHPKDSRFVLAVREVRKPGSPRSKMGIVCIDTVDSTEKDLAHGSDFYSHARFNHDGTMLCWLEWDHPHMPWTGARLFVALWSSGLGMRRRIGYHSGISQPRWGLDRKLFYCYDDTGYQQLYHVDFEDGISHRQPQWLRINGLEERELAGAEFLLSSNTYFHLDGNYMVVAYTEAARSQLALIDYVSGTYADFDVELNDIAYDALQRINSREFLAIGATSNSATALYHITLPRMLEGLGKNISCRTTKIAQSFDTSRIPEGTLSTPIPKTFPRSHVSPTSEDRSPGPINVSHAFLMRPTNANYTAAAEELPPCIVMAHGGPTKHYRPSVNLEAQYFTSRGYLVALLNHVGSTGYGKAYRDAMDGLWGVADIQDAVDLVQALTREGLIDPKRVGITGPSAGGYLTLQAVCTRPEVWAGAVSVFGISDMAGFVATTHHFESHYDYLLVRGRESLDQRRAAATETKTEALRKLYASRSPITRARDHKVPVLLLQGSEDGVVTPDQASAYAEAANHCSDDGGRVRETSERNVELIMYEHEGHGFHLASTKKDSLERTEQWWRRTLA